MKDLSRNLLKLKFYLGIIFTIFFSSFVLGATNLSPGDLFVVMSNASAPDSFSFVSKENISSGTVIYFTDNARSGDNTRRTGEGTLVFTSTQNITSATVISITGSSSTPSVLPSGIGNISKDGGFNLSASNDNIIAYQGVGVGDPAPSFLYGIGFSDSSSWISSGSPSTNNSYIPLGLSLGDTAIVVSYNNNQYMCANLGMLTTSFASDIANSSNWTGNNSNIYNTNTCGFDAIAPVLSFSSDTEIGPVKSDTIAVNRDDATVKRRMYDTDGACSTAIGDYSNNYTVSLTENTETNNGNYICFYGEDSAGNLTTLSTTNPINIDITKPTASISYNPSTLTNTDVVAILTGESEVIIIDSGGGNTYNFITNGTHLFEFHDAAGNTGENLATVTRIDKNAPTWVTNNGTIVGPIQIDTINMTANDPNLDGASLIYGFSTDNICDGSDTYATSFTNSTDFNIAGDHTDYLCVRGSDTVGNISYQLVGQLNTDNTSPNILEVTAVNSPTNDNTPDYTFSSSEVGSISYGGDCSSPTTGVTVGNNTITFNILAEGTHSNCTITVTDTAGNISSTLNITSFEIDQSAPTWATNDGTEAGPVNNDTINLTASDINLDTANLYYGFSVDNICDGSDTYTTSFTNSTDFNIGGDHTDYLCVKGNDIVGNTSYYLVGQLNTDNTSPIISFTDDVDLGPTQADSIAATRGDATITKREYNIDTMCPTLLGSYSNTYTIPFTEDTEANNGKYICLYAEDSIGNKSILASSQDINIDITKPTASVSYNPSTLTNTDVLATLTGESEGITIDSVGGDTHNFIIDGTHLFEFHDVAGNTGETLATVNWIDKTLPELTGTSTVTTSNADTNFAKVGDIITVTFSVTEDLISNPSVNIVGGGVFNLASQIGNTYSYNRTMQSTDPNGIINISVAIEDLATNVNSDTIASSITFDKTSPSGIVITAPSDDERLKGSNGVDPAINFNITRNIGTETNYGPNPLQIQYSSLGDFSDTYNISTGTEDDGSYVWTIPANYNTDTARIRIIATDAAGNSSTFTSNYFNIDSIKPTEIFITTPDGNEFLKGGDIYDFARNGGVESNIATQQYWLSYNGGGSSQAVVINVGNKRDVPSNINRQDVTMNMKITDKAGWRNDGNSSMFTIDNIDPTLSFNNNSARRNTTVIGNTTVGDNFALRLTGNNAVYKSTAFTDSCDGGVLTIPTYSADGTYTSYACIADRAGNITTGQQFYNIDKTTPFVDPGSDKITNTGIYQGTVVNDILSGGVISDILSVNWTQISGPGTAIFNPSNTGNTTISADIDGLYLLKLTAIDNAGNTTSGTINFTRDTVDPIITGGSVINTDTSSPGYSFWSNEIGAVSYSGLCANGNISAVAIGENNFNYSSRGEATYNNCQLIINDLAGNTTIHNVPTFTVNLPSSGGGGGGGGGGAKKDDCRENSDLPGANEYGEDYSPSKYDKTCLAEEDEEEEEIEEDVVVETGTGDGLENTVVLYGNDKSTIFALIEIPHFDDAKFDDSMGIISDYIANKVSKKSIPVSELSLLMAYYNTFLSEFVDYKNNGNESAQDDAVVALSTFMLKLNKYPDTGSIANGDELSMAIQFLYNNGLTKFSTKETFRPDALITREQAAKFLVVYAEKIKGVTVDSDKTYVFADINDGDPTLKDYVLKSYQMGIFNGYGSVFKPHRNLTKGGALAVLLRVYLSDGLNEYTYPRYKEYYNKALELGLTTDQNIRSGDSDVTRGELALFIYRISQK